MKKRQFWFVSGDIGGARMMVPVAQLLKSLNQEVIVTADENGKGFDIWANEEIEVYRESDEAADFVFGYDLVFISSCASASKAGERIAKNCYGKVPVVIGADSFFNHGFLKWQAIKADYWFAITEGHAQAIRALRPNLVPERVIVVGQPAFDKAMYMISKKEEIRSNRRRQFGINNEKVILWWPTGLGELIEEDIEMVKAVIKELVGRGAIFLMNGCHPKLENVHKGYIAEIIGRISDWCRFCDVDYINTQSLNIPFGELYQICLAADVILSITCTEDTLNTMMGGPPVVHLLGPKTQNWMETELFLKPPQYLPDIISGESFLATSVDEIPLVLAKALKPETEQQLRRNWRMPTEGATKKIAEKLIELAL